MVLLYQLYISVSGCPEKIWGYWVLNIHLLPILTILPFQADKLGNFWILMMITDANV